VLNTTYSPDNDPVQAQITEEGTATFTAPTDAAGILKQISIEVSEGAPEARVTHTLINNGRWPIQLAPWAITMCRVGGVALLPQPAGPTDPGGFLPNRRFSFWPYSDISDARIALANRVCLIRANPGPNNKIGYRNAHGWFAYLFEGTLFSKRFAPSSTGEYPDHGCNAEFFLSQNVIELESLGPLTRLAPGERIAHEEIWRLDETGAPLQSEEDAIELAKALQLDL
jgi:hypothetical protein